MRVLISRSPTVSLPTIYGTFQVTAYSDGQGLSHFLMVLGEPGADIPMLVRIHSKCLTGDVFGSLRCDCHDQLVESIHRIAEAGQGVLLYLDQEGRGIGLFDKMRAYALQEQGGLDTVEANLAIGRPVDERDFHIAADILSDIGVRHIILLTNNPEKLEVLEQAGFEVTREPLFVGQSEHNQQYLRTKRQRLGHFLGALTSDQLVGV
jgi:GTP cyclohydrolase II